MTRSDARSCNAAMQKKHGPAIVHPQRYRYFQSQGPALLLPEPILCERRHPPPPGCRLFFFLQTVTDRYGLAAPPRCGFEPKVPAQPERHPRQRVRAGWPGHAMPPVRRGPGRIAQRGEKGDEMGFHDGNPREQTLVGRTYSAAVRIGDGRVTNSWRGSCRARRSASRSVTAGECTGRARSLRPRSASPT